ncbi:MAG: DUF86 domain-containing protein [Erysipelotrichaceae bacterium]|nr:DUF86 domain-containing protein [Erysipelotrichaceae bacterium]
MRRDLAFIIRQMKGVSISELKENEILLDSMMFRMIQISENARKLSDDYRQQHSTVPWTAVFGLRNRVVHDYGNVDLNIIYSTLKEDIPVLFEELGS